MSRKGGEKKNREGGREALAPQMTVNKKYNVIF